MSAPTSRTRGFLCLLGFTALPAALFLACGVDNGVGCDPGLQLVGGSCVPIDADAGSEAGADANPASDARPDAASDAGSDTDPPDPDFHFGGVSSVSPASAQ